MYLQQRLRLAAAGEVARRREDHGDVRAAGREGPDRRDRLPCRALDVVVLAERHGEHGQLQRGELRAVRVEFVSRSTDPYVNRDLLKETAGAETAGAGYLRAVRVELVLDVAPAHGEQRSQQHLLAAHVLHG